MKKFLQEFKAFALKGNVMSMAVGVIIGGAFQSIVTSLTENFIKPLIAVFTGGVKTDEAGNPQFIGGAFNIHGVEFNYGAFLSAVINFLIMALILFLLIKGMNKLMEIGHKKEAEQPAAPPAPDPQLVLLTEIRDLLKVQQGEAAELAEEADDQ